jgi:hypothetical protein
MRSAAFTLVLLVLAALLSGLAGWSLRQGNLDALLGAPLTPPGQRLYQDFTHGDVARIHLKSGGVELNATKTPSGWVINKPWNDRMDPRAAVSIIDFSLGLRVEDSSDVEKIDTKVAGLEDDAVGVSLFNADGSRLSHYRLGRRSPWMSIFKEGEPPVATVFIRTRDDNRKDHAYICTGDITPLFKEGMKFLRDHRPFYFNPIALQKIRIRSDVGELSIGREHPSHPWRIFKPLDLPTDPAAVKLLLEKLYELQAVGIADRASVTLPINGSTAKTTQIGMTNFGSKVETLLEIHAPEAEDVRDVLATVSDRPDTVFSLPSKPETGLVSIVEMPLSVNELRDPTLTNLNIASLRGILIRPITGNEILLTRLPEQPWKVAIDDREHLANELRLFELLKAITEGRAIGFETDAATDLSPWGLNRPVLVLRILGGDNQTLELNFGLDGKGGIFAQRTGTPTVMRVDAELLAGISVRPYEWRHARLWSLSKVDLMAIERITNNGPPLLLRYNDIDQSWKAQQDEKDVSANLVQTRANFMLDHMEGLETSRWLSKDDPDALAALASPVLVFDVVEKEVDDFSELKGIKRRRLEFAPVSSDPGSSSYYGRMSTEPNLFLIDRDSYLKLSLGLMEGD